MSRPLDRREFHKTMGAVAAGALTAGFTATSRGFWANETINIALIGTGGRCRFLAQSLVKIPGTKVVAICDVQDSALNATRKQLGFEVVSTKNYRELLDRQDIDAVLIATSDHWHVPITIDACAAGKDVYVEKPLTHDLTEGLGVIDAQNRHNRIVQVGTQQRSMPHFQEGKKMIDEGKLGEIHKVHLTWNRNAPRHKASELKIDPATVDWKTFLGNAKDQPFDPYRLRNWRWFWDFGGGILTDLMTHQLDIAHWFLGLDHPATAATIGDQFQSAGLWETPDTIQTLLHYPDKQVQVYFEGTFSNARNAAMLEFMGSEGTLYLDRGRYEVHPERKSKLEPSEMILGTGGRGQDFYDKPDGEMLHLVNWIECIRSRAKPNCPAEAGVSTASGAHLGNIAFRSGKVAKWGETG